MAVQRDIRFRNKASVAGGRSERGTVNSHDRIERERPSDHRSSISQFQIIVCSNPVCLSTKDSQELENVKNRVPIFETKLCNVAYSTHDKIPAQCVRRPTILSTYKRDADPGCR